VAPIVSDVRIEALIAERKQFPANYKRALALQRYGAHSRSELDVVGEAGSSFHIALRRSVINPLDFSIILAAQLTDGGPLFHLRRYNGRAHRHTNKLENRRPFYDYHVHVATERYQYAGLSPEGYAEITDRYVDLQGAFNCFVEDCACVLPDADQFTLFGGVFL